ncbi:MAG: DUF6544 family protein [Nannocystaceae bacterium]
MHDDLPTLEQLWAADPHEPVSTFDPDRLAHLPRAVQRHLRCAIEPGAPLHGAIRLRMRGEIKLGSWRPFEAEQVIRWGRGMIWRARAKMLGPLAIKGHDAIVDGVGQMRWRLAGIIPVIRADGPDITRSAAGRRELESVLLPSVLLHDDVQWEPSDDDHQASACVHVAGGDGRITIEVDDDGQLVRAWMPRWGNPEGGEHHEVPFGVRLSGQVREGGYAVPRQIRAGWYFDDPDRFEREGEFFRGEILGFELG